jgi:hypothetical protein
MRVPPVQADAVIRVKNDFNPELIIVDKLAQRASIHDGVNSVQ